MACDRMIGRFECCSVVQGDCLELMRELSDGCVDAVITDPPYGIRISDKNLGAGRTTGIASSPMIYGSWDNERVKLAAVDEMRRISENQIIWGGNYFADMVPASMGWLIWYKRDGLPTRSYSDAELAWTSYNAAARVFCSAWDGFIREGGEERNGHPTQKPLRLMEWCTTTLPTGETILDPFCGSGTTLVAAKKLGRHFLGFEISEDYCKIARDRLARIEAQPTLFAAQAEQLTLGSEG